MLNNKEDYLEDRQKRKKMFGAMLLVIFLVGTGLRFLQLGYESFWLDETATGLRVQMSWSQMFQVLAQIKAHPPLHYIILKAWSDIFGYSEFSLRFISSVFSCLSILLFYQIAKMMFSEKTAILAAAILAVSRFHIDLAQEARCYALMGFLVLLSMYFLIRLWQTPNWGTYIGYILASAGMLYNHYYAVFILAAQTIFFAVMCLYQKPVLWKRLISWFAAQSLIGLLFLPWVTTLCQAVKEYGDSPTALPVPGLPQLLACLSAFSGGQRWAAIIFLFLACLSLYGILKTKKDRSGKKIFVMFYLTCLWLVVPFALAFFYSLLKTPILGSRYVIVSSYPYILLIAFGISCIRIKSIRYVLTGVILLTCACTLLPRYFAHEKQQWRQATSYIESKAVPGQALLFHAPFCMNTGYKFYAKRNDLVVLGFPLGGRKRNRNFAVTKDNVGQITPLVQDHSHVWLVLSHSRDKEGLILEELRKSFLQQEHVSFNKIEAYLFKKKDSTSPPLMDDNVGDVPGGSAIP